MLTRRLGKTGLEVSVIGLGTWNIGNQCGQMDDATATSIIESAIKGGMNLLDSAESYGIPNGESEIRLGRTIGPYRDDLVLVSKIGNWGKRTGQGVPKTTVDMIRLCGHAICGRLNTEYVDVVLCHEGNIEDPSIYVKGLEALKAEGFVRAYGISTNSLDVLKRFVEQSEGECAVVELDYSLINKSPEAEMLPYCQSQDLGVLIRGPVAMGLLAGKYDENTVFTDAVRKSWNVGGEGRQRYEERLASLSKVREALGDNDMVEAALQYVISHPCGPVAIPGATSVDQALSNARAGGAFMDADLYQKLSEL